MRTSFFAKNCVFALKYGGEDLLGNRNYFFEI